MVKVTLNPGEKFCGAYPAGTYRGRDGDEHLPNSWYGMMADGRFFLEYWDGSRDYYQSPQEHEQALQAKLIWPTLAEGVELAGKDAEWNLSAYDAVSFPLEPFGSLTNS